MTDPLPPTPKELARLRLLRSFRATPPTVGRYLRINWWLPLLQLAAGGATVAIASWAGLTALAWACGGAFAAMMLRDVGWYRQNVLAWPLTREILDWDRVDALLAEHDKG